MTNPAESVVIHNFWLDPIVFHARHDPGTRCDTEDRRYLRGLLCGHALPRRVAERIAKPCRRCYPEAER